MSADPPWTIGRLLQWTTAYFKQQQTGQPRLDAEVLLADSCGCQRIELYTTYDQVASDEVRGRFRELVRRRAAGEPVAYLVGRREFYSLPFAVSPAVLIPRPETELVVLGVLDAVKQCTANQGALRLVDVGTGSGAIAVTLARHLAGCEITATDISTRALDVARRNAAALGVGDRIRFLQGDLLSALPPVPQFDIVASNPPYVSDTEHGQLPREVQDYEPREALVAGPTGAEVIERLVPQAAERLVAGGIFLVEVSPMIVSRVRELFAAEPRFLAASVTKDLAGLPRVVAARRGP